MSQILDLGNLRTDEDSSTYDFYDLDDSMGDDGTWNFENEDHDDTDGDPNNDDLLAQYDFGDLNEGVDPTTIIEDGKDWDMDTLNVDARGAKPGEFSEIDDGEFSFQNLDNDDTDGDLNNNDKNAEYDYSSLEDGTVEDSYIEPNTDSDMMNMIDPWYDDLAKFDFGEVTNEGYYSKKDPEALEYNFGSLDEYPDRNIYLYMVKLIRDAVRDAISNGELETKVVDIFNPMSNTVIFQYYYNYESNKAYIEFEFSDNIRKMYNKDKLVTKITSYIHSNFKRELGYYPEILFVEDGVDERVDNSPIITPFTVGYWQSLAGGYRFIEDETRIMLNMRKYNTINYGVEYNTLRDELYKKYTESYRIADDNYNIEFVALVKKYNGDVTTQGFKDDVKQLTKLTSTNKAMAMTTFENNLYILNKKFKISPDKRPEKTFEDFCKIVTTIHKNYEQTYLTEEQKLSFFKDYNDLYINYHDTDEFNSKLSDLKNNYAILSSRNKNVPKMFQDYKKAYDTFFDTSLPEVNAFVYKKFVEVA